MSAWWCVRALPALEMLVVCFNCYLVMTYSSHVDCCLLGLALVNELTTLMVHSFHLFGFLHNTELYEYDKILNNP